MAQRLKRWESPRKEGRNDKGRGGSARQRQLKKQTQMLRKKLKEEGGNAKDRREGTLSSLSFLFFSWLRNRKISPNINSLIESASR